MFLNSNRFRERFTATDAGGDPLMPSHRHSDSLEQSSRWKRVVDSFLGARPESERAHSQELDLAAVAELADRQRKSARERMTQSLRESEEPLRITGEINTGTTERLLRGLAGGKYSGTFQASSADKTVRLGIARKQLMVLDTGDPEHRLGAMALREALIDRHQLIEALKYQSIQDVRPSLGRILLSRSLTSEPALRWLLHRQAVQVVAELRRWQDGFFLFEEHDIDLEAGSPLLDPMLQLERLVYGAGRTRGF